MIFYINLSKRWMAHLAGRGLGVKLRICPQAAEQELCSSKPHYIQQHRYLEKSSAELPYC